MKLKVTNIANRNFGVNASEGTVFLDPGETYEGEFDDNEATALNRQTDTWKVEGYKEPAGGDTQAAPSGDAAKQIAALTKQVADLTKENADLKSQLAAATSAEPVSLEDAIAGLDNANDAHWTKGGKPSLEHLQHVTGKADLTRAEVDALNVERKA